MAEPGRNILLEDPKSLPAKALSIVELLPTTVPDKHIAILRILIKHYADNYRDLCYSRKRIFELQEDVKVLEQGAIQLQKVVGKDAIFAEEARKWDSGECKPTDVGWEDVITKEKEDNGEG